MKALILTAALALAAVAAPAAAQDFPTPQQIIQENDKNGDGAIDRAEWAASPAPVPFPEEADTNHDGKIDRPNCPQRCGFSLATETANPN